MATETLQLLITAAGSTAAKEIAGVGAASQAAGAQMTLFQTASSKTGQALNSLSGGIIPVSAGLKTAAVAGGALVGVGLAKWALEGVDKFVSLGNEIRGFQRVTGASAEDASRLAAAVRLSGVDASAAETGFFQLGKRIAQGKDTLDDYGAASVRVKFQSGDIVGALEDAAAAFQRIKDPAEQNAFVMENFGKGGKALIPILQKSREELEAFFESAAKHGEIMSQQDLTNVKEFGIAVKELEAALGALALAAGRVLTPILTQVASTFTNVVDTVNQATGSADGFGSILGHVNDFLNPLNTTMNLTAGAADLLKGNWSAAGEEFARSIPIVNGIWGLFDSGSESAGAFADKQKELADATRIVADAQLSGKTNTESYRNALATVKDLAPQLAAAQQEVANALQSEASAAYAAANALLAKNAADLAAQGSIIGVRAAVEQKTLADERQITAQQELQVAQDNYNAAVATYGPTSVEAFVAQSALTEATHNATAADINADSANVNLKGSIEKTIAAVGAKAIADNEGKSSSEQHKAAVDAQNQAIIDLYNSSPIAAAAVRDLGYSVITLPGGKQIVITAPTGEARGEVESLIGWINSQTAYVNVIAQGVGTIEGNIQALRNELGYSKGGFVGGTGNTDSVPALLTPGEFVISHDMMREARRGVTPATPLRDTALRGSGGGGEPIHIEIVSVLDGQVVARNTVRHLNRAGGPKLKRTALN